MVSFAASANRRLESLTGFRLQRARPASSPDVPAPRRTPGGQGRTEAAQELRLPAHYGREANDIIRRVKPRTMTPPVRVYGLIQAVRHVIAAGVPGDFVECGVWRGGSMQAIAWTLQEQGVLDRDLHLFDTFEGMTEPTEEDVRARDGVGAAHLLAEHGRGHSVWARAGIDDVRAGMDETGYPSARIHYHRGKVEETVPDHAPEQIAVLRLDTDWYASTKHELEHLYPRLSPGGVLLIDDYGHWEGARQAVEEFLDELDTPLLLLPLAAGRIALKP